MEVLPSKMSIRAEGWSNAFAKTYGSPPWSSSPPQGTDPDTASLLHGAQSTLDCLDADGVVAGSHLTKESPDVVGLQP